MAKILCIETSTEICSVALAEGSRVVDLMEDHSGMSHSKQLTQFILDLLRRNNLQANELDAIAVSEGPGSYTGLRIGVSAAKGICYSVGLPLIAINPLQAMASYVLANENYIPGDHQSMTCLVPMIDARRMEVYCNIFDTKGVQLKPTEAVVVDEHSFSEELQKGKVLFFGNGSSKCKTVIHHENAQFIDGIVTTASSMVQLANEKFMKEDFVDVAYFEPFYLKDFIATVPKKNLLTS